MPKASEIKKNQAVEYEGRVYFVKDIERSVPQGRAGGSRRRNRYCIGLRLTTQQMTARHQPRAPVVL